MLLEDRHDHWFDIIRSLCDTPNKHWIRDTLDRKGKHHGRPYTQQERDSKREAKET
jgi:hypothetical protein